MLYFDGGCQPNPGKGGCGAVIELDHELVWEGCRSLPGTSTNNAAEYGGLLLGLTQVLTLPGLRSLEVRGDSNLVVKQLSGAFACHSPELRPLLQRARDLLARMPFTARFEHIDRASNAAADALASEGMRGSTYSRPLGSASVGGGVGGGGGAVPDTVAYSSRGAGRLCAACFQVLPTSTYSSNQRGRGARGRCMVFVGKVPPPQRQPQCLARRHHGALFLCRGLPGALLKRRRVQRRRRRGASAGVRSEGVQWRRNWVRTVRRRGAGSL